MSVTIGNARISENGTVVGTKGDQTGKEVMTQAWSSGGTWEYVIRPNSVDSAKKIAAAMNAACKNNNIGYSQSDRLSLYNLASKNGWKLDKVGKCNCDCSSLVAVCVNAAGIKVAQTMYTGNERQLLSATGKFTVISDKTYTKKEGKLKTGDILLRTGHTAIVVNGAVALEPSQTPAPAKKPSISQAVKDVIAGKYGNGIVRTNALKKLGFTEDEIKKIQDQVNKKLSKKKSVEVIAKEVIKGKWGNEPKRSEKLRAAGYTSTEIKKIQAQVNKLLK